MLKCGMGHGDWFFGALAVSMQCTTVVQSEYEILIGKVGKLESIKMAAQVRLLVMTRAHGAWKCEFFLGSYASGFPAFDESVVSQFLSPSVEC